MDCLLDKYYWTRIVSSPIFMGFIMELVREYHTKQIDLSGGIITVPKEEFLDEIRARISEKEDVKDCCFYIGEGNE